MHLMFVCCFCKQVLMFKFVITGIELSIFSEKDACGAEALILARLCKFISVNVC